MKIKKNTTDKVNTAPAVNPAPEVLRHSKAPSKLGTLPAFATSSGKAISLTDQHLHKFQIIEGEAALAKDRAPLLCAFSDGINWPFRTAERKVEGKDTTIIQISSGWIKQLTVLDVALNAFKAFCENGHLENKEIRTAFDTSFTRPEWIYTCPGCGESFSTSYKLATEAHKRGCIPCNISAADFPAPIRKN